MIELQQHTDLTEKNFESLLCFKDKEQNSVLRNFLKTFLIPQNLINEKHGLINNGLYKTSIWFSSNTEQSIRIMPKFY